MDAVLRLFSESRARARQKYREFMDDGVTVKKQDVYATVDQRLLGDDRFVDRIAEEHGKVKKERRKRAYSLDQIAAAVAKAGEVSVKELRGSSRYRELAQGRVAFTVLAKDYGYRGTEIAAYLQRDPTAITQYVRKREKARQIIAAVENVIGEENK